MTEPVGQSPEEFAWFVERPDLWPPLTDDEERKFRESVRLLGDDGILHWTNNVAMRLLATLDAARVATVRPPGDEAWFYVSAPMLSEALYLALGWSTARYRPDRPHVGDDWATYDPIPEGIVSGDADHPDWTNLTVAVLRHLRAAGLAPAHREEPTDERRHGTSHTYRDGRRAMDQERHR